jgi:hypothetical protein
MFVIIHTRISSTQENLYLNDGWEIPSMLMTIEMLYSPFLTALGAVLEKGKSHQVIIMRVMN